MSATICPPAMLSTGSCGQMSTAALQTSGHQHSATWCVHSGWQYSTPELDILHDLVHSRPGALPPAAPATALCQTLCGSSVPAQTSHHSKAAAPTLGCEVFVHALMHWSPPWLIVNRLCLQFSDVQPLQFCCLTSGFQLQGCAQGQEPAVTAAGP